ncbi:hypothetical protein MLD38_033779 [Melastoma candidum]|uniref:Uncharacterized protein n=1 Tax=Melastoma candidum TaxID=119954 RepID=A0ACB9M8F7_9MYRT|nr:hypothetical protein MLD38_033779 [Melastoma candidum]
MGRQPCCEKIGLKKGPWTAEEDRKLITFLLNNGQCCWRAVPKLAGLLRCGKSCRLRWTNYLRPDLKRGLLSESEEKLVIDLHSQLGNRWSKIASQMPGRTDNEIKNHWNTHIKKKLRKMGIDPMTHKTIHDVQNQQQKQQQQEEDEEEEEEEEREEALTSQAGHRNKTGLDLPTFGNLPTEEQPKPNGDPGPVLSVSSSMSSSLSSATSSMPCDNRDLFGDIGFLFLDNDEEETKMDFWNEDLFTWEAFLSQNLAPPPPLEPITWNHVN